MSHKQTTVNSSEIDELKRVKEAFQLEMVSEAGLSALRMEFLRDAIGLLTLELDKEDQQLTPGGI